MTKANEEIKDSTNLKVSRQTVYRDIAYLSSIEMIAREGSKKKGCWIIADLQ